MKIRATLAALALMALPWMTPQAQAKDDLVIGVAQFPSSLHPDVDAEVVKQYVLGFVTRPITAAALSGFLVCAIAAMAALRAHDALIVLAFGALIVALASLTSSGSRIGASAVGVYLGEISYAVYMVCIPWKLLFVNGVHRLFGFGDQLPPVLWLVFVAGVVPVAALGHHLVERPARKWLRALASRPKPAQPQFA